MTEALRRRITGPYRTERATAMEQVARELGLHFQKLAGPGEPYTNSHGEDAKLPAGITAVSVVVDTDNLGTFWNKVNERDLPFTKPNTSSPLVPAKAQ